MFPTENFMFYVTTAFYFYIPYILVLYCVFDEKKFMLRHFYIHKKKYLVGLIVPYNYVTKLNCQNWYSTKLIATLYTVCTVKLGKNFNDREI